MVANIIIGMMSYLSLSIPVDKSMLERKILVTQEATLWQLLFEGLTNNQIRRKNLKCLLNTLVENGGKCNVDQREV